MRKWTKSACMVLAWSILPTLAAAGMERSASPVQATQRIASSTTQVTLMTFMQSATTRPVDRRPGEYTLAGTTYIVRPGDTLSGIATALGVPGGWRALYAANRQAIGSDPGIIHPGTVLTAVRATTRATATARARPAPERPSPDRTTPSPILAGQAPAPTSPMARATVGAGSMPRWLKAMLLAVGIVTGLALLTESTLAVGRRLRNRRRRLAVTKASIIRADHERLIVTYSLHDDTIYLLTPPGEDPRTVLRAARLVLPEEKYLELADELGMPENGPAERP